MPISHLYWPERSACGIVLVEGWYRCDIEKVMSNAIYHELETDGGKKCQGNWYQWYHVTGAGHATVPDINIITGDWSWKIFFACVTC